MENEDFDLFQSQLLFCTIYLVQIIRWAEGGLSLAFVCLSLVRPDFPLVYGLH